LLGRNFNASLMISGRAFPHCKLRKRVRKRRRRRKIPTRNANAYVCVLVPYFLFVAGVCLFLSPRCHCDDGKPDRDDEE
jgi:hypothetical protein